MPGFDGTGPRGMGPMTGGGRGFCSPWGLRQAYGFPTRGYGYYPYRTAGYAVPFTGPFVSPMTREQELDSLKSQAQTMREQLEQIEARIQQLGKEA